MKLLLSDCEINSSSENPVCLPKKLQNNQMQYKRVGTTFRVGHALIRGKGVGAGEDALQQQPVEQRRQLRS